MSKPPSRLVSPVRRPSGSHHFLFPCPLCRPLSSQHPRASTRALTHAPTGLPRVPAMGEDYKDGHTHAWPTQGWTGMQVSHGLRGQAVLASLSLTGPQGLAMSSPALPRDAPTQEESPPYQVDQSQHWESLWGHENLGVGNRLWWQRTTKTGKVISLTL